MLFLLSPLAVLLHGLIFHSVASTVMDWFHWCGVRERRQWPLSVSLYASSFFLYRFSFFLSLKILVLIPLRD